MWQAFCHLLSAVWKNLLAALSTSTLSVVCFSLVLPVLGFLVVLIPDISNRKPSVSVLTIIKTSALSWGTLAGAIVTLGGWVILFGYFFLKTVLADQLAPKDRTAIKIRIMQFVGEAQQLMQQCPNSIAPDEEANLWLELMGEWRDKATNFLLAECSEIAARRFNALGAIRDSTFVGTHRLCHSTKSVTVALKGNLISIVENIDAYL
jgi:hypothetical protein